jgi:hypothetical protein
MSFQKIHCHVCQTHIGGSLHATYTRDPGRNACARVKCRTLGTDELVGLSSNSLWTLHFFGGKTSFSQVYNNQ